jgi:diguanylate cyclase (GGDEF)-like protein
LTFDDSLLRNDGTGWAPAAGAAQLPRMVVSLAETHDLLGHERLWLGTGVQGLWFRQDGAWQRFTAPGFDAAQIEDLLVAHRDGREQLWIATLGAGLWRLDDSGLRAWSVASGDLRSDELYSLAQSRLPNGDDILWAASHGDAARVFDRRYGLPSDVVRDLSVWRSPDGVQMLWLATENGIARTIAGVNPWQIASLLGSSSIGVFAVLVEPDGHGGERLWAGAMNDGLGLYENGRWRHFGPDDGLPAPSVRMIKHAPDLAGADTLWAGFDGGALARVLSGPVFRKIAVPWEQSSAQAVTDIFGRQFDGARELWVATRTNGLYRWRDDHWSAMRPAGVPDHWTVTALVGQTDARGRAWLWATSSLGLVRYDGRELRLFGPEAGLPEGNLSGIALFRDPSGSVLWIGSQNGFVRVDVGDPANPHLLPQDLPPPPDPETYGALRDSTGRIYICTNNGVQQLTPTPHGYVSRVFTRRDGMPHDECNTNAQFIDAHDRFWTGTLGGLGVYDPANGLTDREPKPLKIVDVHLDGKAIRAGQITLEPGQKDLSIRFALLSWLNEEKSEFRTQLLGDEAAPTDWTHQNSRVFDRLPPGTYTLRVEARDYAGNPSTPIELPITVLPAWWQTTVARMAFALAAALTLYLLLQWRLRALKARQHRLEKEVNARTAELHAANARLLELSYRDPLTGLANRRKLRETLDAASARGDATPFSLIFVDVDRFKEYNDRFGHPAGDEALRGVAAAMLDCTPRAALVARYGGEEFACLLPGTGLAGACDIAERIRASVQERAIPLAGVDGENRVTISAGVAECAIAAPADAHRLLRDADAALYLAKAAGRNCVRYRESA